MKKFSALLVLVLLLTGCTGSFRLTGKVYQFNREIEDQWVEELVFLGFCIVPVYEIALFADAIVLNSIEFWTGENPMASSGTGLQEVIRVDDREAVVTYLTDGRVMVETGRSGFILERTESGVAAGSLDGEMEYRASTNPDGTVSVYDEPGNLIQTFDPGEWMPPGY